MGLLIDGVWRDEWYDTESSGGRFVRKDAQFRDFIRPDAQAEFPAQKGRYHLYVSYACPWAHRVLIMRKIKGLEDMVSLSVVNPLMRENGWTFAPDEGVLPDPLHHADYLHQIYTAADAHYSGRVTVPVLWDKQRGTIVNNESSEIMRMFNSAFDGLGAKEGDYAPAELLAEIDAVNAFVYDNINNGVYKAGFATRQEVYTEEVHKVFAALDKLEALLAENDYLAGGRLTEADWRLFTTLVRFDAVYYGHFKCNLRRLSDYPALWAYTRRLYHFPGVAQTVHFGHIKAHYYRSHTTINPNGIVPEGPQLDFSL